MQPVLKPVATFWGGCLDLGLIRVVPSFWARQTGRAFVIHNRVHWPGAIPEDLQLWEQALLVHELGHCWQAQSGQWQLSRGILEQTLFTVFGLLPRWLGRPPLYDPYDYGGADGLAATARLTDLALEGQATVIEHYWLATHTGADILRGERLRDDLGQPTPFLKDLRRLCQGIGLP